MSILPLIRQERSGDAPGVRAMLEAAFGGTVEADLVERLRAGGDLVLALVAEQAERIVGYAAFPRLDLDLGERIVPVVGLAPLAVSPDRQRTGIGAALIGAGIARLKDRAEGLVFVLGDPAYYGRHGFAVMDGYVSRYAGPHFQTMVLAPHAPKSGRLTYPQAFDALG